MKDSCQKMEGKTNFSSRLKKSDGLSDWLWPPILPPIYATGIYASGQWMRRLC